MIQHHQSSTSFTYHGLHAATICITTTIRKMHVLQVWYWHDYTINYSISLSRCSKPTHMHTADIKFTLPLTPWGNQVLKHMLMNLHGKLYPFFGEVLLLHSDVEDDVFEPGQPFCKLEALAERTHMYIHKSDDALWISRMTKNFNKRLGKRGPKNLTNLNDETFVIDTTQVPSGDNFKEQKIDHWGIYRKRNRSRRYHQSIKWER